MVTKSSNLAKLNHLYPRFVTLVIRETKRRQEYVTSQYTPGHELKFNDTTWTNVPRRAVPYAQCIPEHSDPIFETDDASACVEAFYFSGLATSIKLSRDDGTSIENPSFDELRFFIILKLLDPIRHMLMRSRTTRFPRQQILKTLDQYIRKWRGQPQFDPGFAPIYNLDADIQPIKLTDFVSLVHFTDDMKSRVIDMVGPLRGVNLQRYAEASHVARFVPPEHPAPRTDPKALANSARLALQSTITSLRLVKDHPVGTHGFIHISRLSGPLLGSFAHLESYDLPTEGVFPRDRYTLDRKELGRFRRNYKLLSQNRFAVWETLDLALRQFNRSCQRLRQEEKVLDYAMILESTLLAGVRDELSYRLALRAGTLLRKQCDPARTFARVRSLYEARSKIIHSNERWGSRAIQKATRVEGLQPEDYMQAIGQLVRDLLSTILEEVSKGRSLVEVRKELDDRIIASL